MNKSIFTLVALVLLAAIVVAGCGGNAPTVGNAQQAVCQALSGLTASVDKLAALGANATTADVKALKTQLDGPVQALKTANQVLNAAPINELATAYDNLAKTVDGLPDNASLGETAVQIQTSVQEVQSGLQQATQTLRCSQ